MDKNENGYPMTDVPEQNGGTVGGVTDGEGNGNRPGGCPGCGCGNGNGCGNNANRPGQGGNGNVGGVTGNHTCGGTGNCLDNMPLAYVYAPNQMFRMLYSANDALRHGTLFEELYKPKEVYGRE